MPVGRQVRTIAVGCGGLIAVMASMTSLTGAVPSIAEATGASQGEMTWIVDAYTIVLAALVLPFGALADARGRRRMLQAGLALFTAASALPLLGATPGTLIGIRAVMGVGAAMILPPTLSLITAALTGTQRGKGVTIWAAAAVLGGVCGMVGTGALIELLDWHAAFVGPAAVSLLVLIGSPLAEESRDPAPPPFDRAGSVASAAAIALVVVGVLEAPVRGWTDPVVLLSLVVGAAAAIWFVRLELRSAEPLLDVRLLREPFFGSGALSVFTQFVILFGTSFVIVQHLQLVLGWSPLAAALIFSSLGLLLVPGAAVAGWLCRHLGLRCVTLAGMGLILQGAAVMALVDERSGTAQVVLALLVMGAGLGVTTQTATSAIVDSVPLEKQGVASAVNDAAREVAAALGLALGGSLLTAGFRSGMVDATLTLPTPLQETARESVTGAAQVAAQLGPPGQGLVQAAQQAFLFAAGDAVAGLMVALLVLTVCLALIAPDKHERTLLAAGAERLSSGRRAWRTAGPGHALAVLLLGHAFGR